VCPARGLETSPLETQSRQCTRAAACSGCRKSGVTQRKEGGGGHEQDGAGGQRGEWEKVDMVNEVECRQRIISMTSKGVVISLVASHPLSPRTASGEPSPRDCINSSLHPGSPFTPHSPFCSASSSPVSSSQSPPRLPTLPTSSLLKHNFRGQTKRVGVAYNEARPFASSTAPFSCRSRVPREDAQVHRSSRNLQLRWNLSAKRIAHSDP